MAKLQYVGTLEQEVEFIFNNLCILKSKINDCAKRGNDSFVYEYSMKIFKARLSEIAQQ